MKDFLDSCRVIRLLISCVAFFQLFIFLYYLKKGIFVVNVLVGVQYVQI